MCFYDSCSKLTLVLPTDLKKKKHSRHPQVLLDKSRDATRVPRTGAVLYWRCRRSLSVGSDSPTVKGEEEEGVGFFRAGGLAFLTWPRVYQSVRGNGVHGPPIKVFADVLRRRGVGSAHPRGGLTCCILRAVAYKGSTTHKADLPIVLHPSVHAADLTEVPIALLRLLRAQFRYHERTSNKEYRELWKTKRMTNGGLEAAFPGERGGSQLFPMEMSDKSTVKLLRTDLAHTLRE